MEVTDPDGLVDIYKLRSNLRRPLKSQNTCVYIYCPRLKDDVVFFSESSSVQVRQ